MENNIMKNTIGLDLGDRNHMVCVLEFYGKVELKNQIENNSESIISFFSGYSGATVAMEAGAQSLWISQLLEKMGLTVLVGNPGKLRMIWKSDKKDDYRDALMLARIARFDPDLLCPIKHRSMETQYDLNQIKARDVLVRTRTNLINFSKGVLKQFGLKVESCGSEVFHKRAADVVPLELKSCLDPILETLEKLTSQIRGYDKQIDQLCKEKYPETIAVRQIRGVGSLTALAYMLILESPDRFPKSRDVGPFLGLTPRRDQSGEVDKQLRITKSGNLYLRRLMVGSAQYILGPFGEDCDLRRFGERLSERGGKNAKRRAVVAV
ncbi:IS110 family transposase, partial [bacterium]|nr:IS110 family transposase [candidate division CSSED10-310 bacterium]